MSFVVGSLVRARGREWVVLPESDPERNLLMLRPLGGRSDEVVGIYLPVEEVETAAFSLPDPEAPLGDHRSGRLLRDAVRLGLRSAAGPFRSLAQLAVEPRPYQLVPLLMALRLDPVRLLIADDVGVGKTIEACLIARELLDRGEIRRLAVLSPPALTDHWQRTLNDQFHLRAAVVLPGTTHRLERRLRAGESLFDRYPYLVVSTEYVKSERRRDGFVRECPELVVVDEAHTCAAGHRASHQRHALLRRLASDPKRHLVLVTATPHSGNGQPFRSLLGLLAGERIAPEALVDEKDHPQRELLARHLVQRRRDDLRAYLATDTPFPVRESREEHYRRSAAHQRFLDRIVGYCRAQTGDETVRDHRRRVRWSVLALLRSLASSPPAAAAALRTRAAAAGSQGCAEADAIGRRTVLDLDDEHLEGIDVAPGCLTEVDPSNAEREELLRLAGEVEKLAGAADEKLRRACEIVRDLLADGFSPILFCRFVPTVEYLTPALRTALDKKVTVVAVTGSLPPEERERRLATLGRQPRRVLVTTDCLSAGINLQAQFDAVVHYDLSWNPTRHEQREGRVDRYGQPRPIVRTVTFYGEDHPVDGAILDVLLRKHRQIHDDLGVAVPVPMDADAVVEAIFQSLLLRARTGERLSVKQVEKLRPRVELVQAQVEELWDAAVERERQSRRIFAQPTIPAAEVAREIAASQRVLGDDRTVEDFVLTALPLLGIPCTGHDPAVVDLRGAPAVLRCDLDVETEPAVRVAFRLPAAAGAERLTRTHPLVGRLAAHLLELALRPSQPGPVRRCAAVRTAAVERTTTVFLVRLRFHVVVGERQLLAEDLALTGFAGHPQQARWCREEEMEDLLGATPDGKVAPELARTWLQLVVDPDLNLGPRLDEIAHRRAEALLADHRRVRPAARTERDPLRVRAHLPPEVLGIFLYFPVPGAKRAGGEA